MNDNRIEGAIIRGAYVERAELDAATIAEVQYNVGLLNHTIVEAAKKGLNIELAISGPALRDPSKIPGRFETLTAKVWR